MNSFTERLIGWYTGNKRQLPWRKNKDPYPIWLSEIILQQTRVEQGLPYWERFMESFPSIIDLANAEEATVLRLWQGLGYYSRARNMHTTAKYVRDQLNGSFPSTYQDILKLKGVGPYTAAAIASICFDEPIPVVDGNVFRFASRYFGIQKDIMSSSARQTFAEVLDKFIPSASPGPGEFNQALMEFGARVCTPSPKCVDCQFQTDCYAFRHKCQHTLPVKTKKIKVRDRYFNYLVLKKNGHYFMNKRGSKDVWQGLYDFALIEGKLIEEEVLIAAQRKLANWSFTLHDVSTETLHLLSHQRIHAVFYDLELDPKFDLASIQNIGLHAFSEEEIVTLPKPQLIVNYLRQKGLKEN